MGSVYENTMMCTCPHAVWLWVLSHYFYLSVSLEEHVYFFDGKADPDQGSRNPWDQRIIAQ